MKLDGLLIIKAFVSLFFGILLLAVPAKLGTIIGLELSSYGIFMAREYGGALIGIFFLCWFSRDSAGSKALNAVILWGFIYDLVNLIVAFAAILSGTMNSLGYSGRLPAVCNRIWVFPVFKTKNPVETGQKRGQATRIERLAKIQTQSPIA